MQTVLGAGGQIATELTRYLHDHVSGDIRLVSRNPRAVHPGDQLFPADLTDPAATAAAVAGSDVVYLVAGLPMDSAQWEQRFPVMMDNAIDASRRHGAKLVFFDNTYMYPKTAQVQDEATRFEPAGRKARVRADIATALLREMTAGRIEALIARAPEFYGPDKTQSLTNTAVFDRLRQHKSALVPVSAHTRRTLIWTPDASRALGLLGDTSEAYGQTWHLPVDPDRLTYAEMIQVAGEVIGEKAAYRTVPAALFAAAGVFNASVREVGELLPRYRQDNLFDSSKFTERFPDFPITAYREGIATLLRQ